jgi:transposase InsO family protein
MSNPSIAAHGWLFTKQWAPWFPKTVKLLDKYERWKRVSRILKVSKAAQLRLEWIIYYHEGYTATQTARHFGISRKTFHKWFREFDEDNLYSLRRLEDKSKAPHHVRQRTITPLEKRRIIKLRTTLWYGKDKLPTRYKTEYGEKISSWKVQKVIEEKKLYRNPKKTARIVRKRKRSLKKKRITELRGLPWYKKKAGYIICLDTITFYYQNTKRYVFTAIDKYGKVAFARMYKNKSTVSARDFLWRLHYLMDGQVPRVGHDNGSEFEKLFRAACEKLGIEQYWSRVKTPKDNPENERFNRTLQDEFVSHGNFYPDPEIFNPRLTEWLIEYNFRRPHQSLGYQTPMNYSQLLPMYSSSTIS